VVGPLLGISSRNDMSKTVADKSADIWQAELLRRT
jgi:hypothetical protein